MLKDKNDKEIVKKLPNKLETTYTDACVYIQNKYALGNSLLVIIPSLDPILCGHIAPHSHFQLLGKFT